MHSFDWQSSNNQILFNPRYSQEELRDILKMLENGPSLKNHFWIATSGSTSLSQGQIKSTALSKEAVLVSAAAVNEFLECTSSDIWLNFLPYFHVGGLGIFARAYLSTSLVIDGYALRRPKWAPEKSYDLLCAHNATLTSLVPAQLFDFVRLQKTTPPTLRAVIVGGGALSDSIYSQAKDLGWKVLPSYGLTECASQVATASPQMDPILETPKLKLLPHIEAKETSEGRIALKSPALLTLYAIKNEKGIHYVDPKKDGWFETEDLEKFGIEPSTLKAGRIMVNTTDIGQMVDKRKLSRVRPPSTPPSSSCSDASRPPSATC